MAYLFRPQRGSLSAAMREVKAFDGTRQGLEAVIGYPVVDVKPYGGFDERIGWDTYLVIAQMPSGVGPAGFTNTPTIG